MISICLILLGLSSAIETKSPSTPVGVRIVRNASGYQLLRDNKPFLIKGGGGDGSLATLQRLGGNSIRTWGVEGLDAKLEQAQKLGLTVAVGIWLGHERHGFDYNNVEQVFKQQEEVRRIVLKYKDHPSVLLWGIGNEMEGEGENAAIWSTINNLAMMVKEIDPNHPTMTVVAELRRNKIKNLHQLCPAIDIVGINSYSTVNTVPQRYREAGGSKPFVLTEFGPAGRWEIGKSSWGAPPEQTSTAKAEAYKIGYETGQSAKECLGSYAFIWGTKQEATATWFGLLLPGGERLGGADALSALWTGKPVPNACPKIQSLILAGSDQVMPGEKLSAKLDFKDPERDPVRVRWVLRGEVSAYSSGGDVEPAPPEYPDVITKSDDNHVELTMPKSGVAYRLFAYVFDDHGGAAVANIPLFVKGPVRGVEARKARLPLVVYDEPGQGEAPFVPTGWMGNVKALKLDEASTQDPKSGKSCLRLDFSDTTGWGGIVWQSPPGDWGDRPGGWNLTGATKLTLWARGETAGEVVSFEFGLYGNDKKFPDSGHFRLSDITLEKEWKEITIDLKGISLERIKSGFAVIVAGREKPTRIYIDKVRYE